MGVRKQLKKVNLSKEEKIAVRDRSCVMCVHYDRDRNVCKPSGGQIHSDKMYCMNYKLDRKFVEFAAREAARRIMEMNNR